MAKNNISAKSAIDSALGLDRYEGDEKTYRSVLENFKRNNCDTLRKLKNAVDEDSGKLAYRIAHSLRGAAGTIGATKLADAAFSIENLLSPKRSECDFVGGEAFEMQMVLLANEYDAVFDELGLLMADEKESGCAPTVMNREKTLVLLNNLAPLLEAGDAESLEYLDEINESFSPAAEGFKLFITQMEQFDFEQAFETMNSIREFMGE